MATRLLANRHIDLDLGAENTRVDDARVLPGTPVTQAHHSDLVLSRSKIGPPVTPWQISAPLSGTQDQRMTESRMSAFTKIDVKFRLVTRLSKFKSIEL
jgi:hypothetical protein